MTYETHITIEPTPGNPGYTAHTYEIRQHQSKGSWTIYRNGRRWGGCDFSDKYLAEDFLARVNAVAA